MRRKRVIIHIGFPKTGTSALQTYFSANADALARSGVGYPYPEGKPSIEEGNCTGNLVQILFRDGFYERYAPLTRDERPTAGRILRNCAPEYFAAIERVCAASHFDTVLLSGEVMSALKADHWEIVKSLADRFDLTLIAFARDFFDYLYSSWRQQAKMEGGAAAVDFEQLIHARRGPEDPGHMMMRAFASVHASGLPLVLLNYDSFRDDITGAFFRAAGLRRPDPEDFQLAPEGYNSSLTGAEALLTTRVDAVLKNRDFAKTVVQMLMSRPPDKRRETRFYSAELDAVILEAYSDTIAAMNQIIVGSKIRSQLRDQPSTKLSIEANDVETLLLAIRRASGLSSNEVRWSATQHNQIASAANLGLPPDFDPEAYLFHNPDVARAGIEPAEHYRRHGRHELRRYRFS